MDLVLFAVEAAGKCEEDWWLDQHAGTVAAVLVVLTALYVFFTHGILKAAQDDRANRLWLQQSEQARQVGGYIRRAQVVRPEEGGRAVLGRELIQLYLVNASQLPVRAVQGILYRVGEDAPVHTFPLVPVLLPSHPTPEQPTAVFEVDTGAEYKLRLIFDDDAGLTWGKYFSAEEPLRLLTELKNGRPRPGR